MTSRDSIDARDVIIGVTGATGAVYAERLIQALIARGRAVHLVMSPTARDVIAHELGPSDSFSLRDAARLSSGQLGSVRVIRHDDLFDVIASGSSAPPSMVIVPCSMGTLSRVATGASTNLLERAADVILKESRRLVVVPRECPLSLIHLRNMTTLAEAGARIVPPMPAFYNRPTTIDEIVDFTVGRILDQLGEPHPHAAVWQGRSGSVNS